MYLNYFNQFQFISVDVLAVDDSVGDDVELPDTLQGSVVALKHILDHPLVFNRGEYANNYNSIHDQPKLKVIFYDSWKKILII